MAGLGQNPADQLFRDLAPPPDRPSDLSPADALFSDLAAPQSYGMGDLRAAEAKTGAYKYGGQPGSKEGTDCSGAMCVIGKQAGIDLPRTAQAQFKDKRGRAVKREELQPGDLVFFGSPGPSGWHVGFYQGGGKFLHQSTDKKPGLSIGDLEKHAAKYGFKGAKRFDQLAAKFGKDKTTPYRPAGLVDVPAPQPRSTQSVPDFLSSALEDVQTHARLFAQLPDQAKNVAARLLGEGKDPLDVMSELVALDDRTKKNRFLPAALKREFKRIMGGAQIQHERALEQDPTLDLTGKPAGPTSAASARKAIREKTPTSPAERLSTIGTALTRPLAGAGRALGELSLAASGADLDPEEREAYRGAFEQGAPIAGLGAFANVASAPLLLGGFTFADPLAAGLGAAVFGYGDQDPVFDALAPAALKPLGRLLKLAWKGSQRVGDALSHAMERGDTQAVRDILRGPGGLSRQDFQLIADLINSAPLEKWIQQAGRALPDPSPSPLADHPSPAQGADQVFADLIPQSSIVNRQSSIPGGLPPNLRPLTTAQPDPVNPDPGKVVKTEPEAPAKPPKADIKSDITPPREPASPLVGEAGEARTGRGVEPTSQKPAEIDKTPPDLSKPDVSEDTRKAFLRQFDPDSLDPLADSFDPNRADALAEALGEGKLPRNAQGEIDPVDVAQLNDRLDTWRHLDDMEARTREDLREFLPELVRMTKGGGEGHLRVYRRKGKWQVDARRQVSFVSTDGLPHHLRVELAERAMKLGSEARYIEPNRYRVARAAGEDITPKVRTMEEMVEREQFIVDMAPGEIAKSSVVPRQAVVQWVADIRASMKAEKAQAAARSLSLTDAQFEAVIRRYTGQPDPAVGRGDPGAAPKGGQDAQPGAGGGRPRRAEGQARAEPDPKLTSGRTVAWKGKPRTFLDAEEEAAYDAVDKASRAKLSEKRKAFNAAATPADRNRINAEMRALQQDRARKLDDFWAEHDARLADREKLERGEPDLDEAFANAVARDDTSEQVVSRPVVSRKSAGFLRLPDLLAGTQKGTPERLKALQDLRKSRSTKIKSKKAGAAAVDSEDISIALNIGLEHYRAGTKSFKAWSKAMLENAPANVKAWLEPRLRAIHIWAARASQEQPIQIDSREAAHLRSVDRGEGVPRSVARWAKYLFLSTEEAAQHARQALESAMGGEDLTGSLFDIEEALNRQSAVGRKVEALVERGFYDSQGNQTAMGVKQMRETMEDEAFDVDLWQMYRRALRENELAERGGIPDDRFMANAEIIARYLESDQAEQAVRWDKEWQKLADEHLKLYAEYGLRDWDWVREMREANAVYFPMHKAGNPVEATMGQLNPQRVASPEGDVIRAKGGARYMDGFASMAREIERVTKAGEQNRAYLPFFDEASQRKEMEFIAREIEVGPKHPDEIDPFAEVSEMEDDVLNFFEDRKRPLVEGQDAIITLRDAGKVRRFEVDPYLWDAIRREDPQAINVVASIARGFASVARGGTTKYNPFFAVLFNPMIDVVSAMIQHGYNPLEGTGLLSLKDAIKEQGLKKAVKGLGFQNLRTGLRQFDDPLYREAVESNALFGSKGWRDMIENEWIFDPEKRNAVQRLGDELMAKTQNVRMLRLPVKAGKGYATLAQAIEESTRLGIYKQRKKSYLKKGLSEPDARRRAAADSRNLMNFGEAGKFGKWLSYWGVPFANVPFQVLQSIGRGARKDPKKFLFRATMMLTAPALAEYALYKDDPDWQALPDYVKFGGYNFKTPLGWFSIRLPMELGVLFKGIPYMALDTALGEKKPQEAIAKELGLIADAYTPSLMPTGLALLLQQMWYGPAGQGGDGQPGTGGVVDLRFMNQDAYPITEDSKKKTKAKNEWKQITRQVDTAFGSLGRYGIKQLGFWTGKEKKAPSPLQRFKPVPDEKKGERSTN